MQRSMLFLYLALIINLMLAVPTTLPATTLMDKFIDPADGMPDTSNWLLNSHGVLPVPIIITEPAVGYGGGLALLFFHSSIAEKAQEQKKADTGTSDAGNKTIPPPSISGLTGIKTENGTWAGGGFHFGTWKNDRIRYLGGAGKTSVYLNFYGKREKPLFKDGVEYNLDGWGTLHELKFRMGNSNVFAGTRITYFNVNSKFNIGNLPGEIEEWELEFVNTGLGLVFEYDSRDNIFTPNRGVSTNIRSMFYSGKGLFDRTREYQIIEAENIWFFKPFSTAPLTMGWRINGSFSTGSVPFYALPFINLRGVPMQRYQGTHILVTELEARYQITPRYGMVAFGGVGQTADAISDFGGNENRSAGGIGARYLIARALGLHSGVDIAKSAEGWTLYFQVGCGL
jgi:hypothetical protein